jgi:hypothetical protein
MKRIELQKKYRELLASNYNLRCLIALDVFVHQQTIQRWATGNSPKLTSDHFIASLKKYAFIEVNELVTEIVEDNTYTNLNLA